MADGGTGGDLPPGPADLDLYGEILHPLPVLDVLADATLSKVAGAAGGDALPHAVLEPGGQPGGCSEGPAGLLHPVDVDSGLLLLKSADPPAGVERPRVRPRCGRHGHGVRPGAGAPHATARPGDGLAAAHPAARRPAHAGPGRTAGGIA
ncbi:hypothetical protein [Streptomyces sp. bgisy031]|uniref:hypothetical protein n=1 Tax=unclassified Streptomyces TaxID=2593676 RepID=UPI003D750CDD